MVVMPEVFFIPYRTAIASMISTRGSVCAGASDGSGSAEDGGTLVTPGVRAGTAGDGDDFAVSTAWMMLALSVGRSRDPSTANME